MDNVLCGICFSFLLILLRCCMPAVVIFAVEPAGRLWFARLKQLLTCIAPAAAAAAGAGA
jgi:hypothetical protein